jgi:hypothetical protein
MGCDIHMYVEHASRSDEPYWRPLGGRINPGRNYELFGFMAGVRGAGPSVIHERGMPTDAAWEAQGDNRLYICDDEGDGNCTPRASRALCRWRQSIHRKRRKAYVGHAPRLALSFLGQRCRIQDSAKGVQNL